MFVIIDPRLPIFIPFGYARIGKTMLIQRLLRYLRTTGYCVQPELVFRNDPLYSEICNKYIEEINGNKIAAATAPNGTILLRIIDRSGTPICYLLDIAGEHQYNINIPNGSISAEMRYFVHSPNPKIWGFMVENNNWLNQQQRQGYVHSIRNMAFNALTPKDKVLFIYNKVDILPMHGQISWRGLFDSADSIFPGIFNPFEETNSIKRLLRGKYKFMLLPFQSGDYFQTSDQYGNDYVNFISGKDEYPKLLWHNILEYIR